MPEELPRDQLQKLLSDFATREAETNKAEKQASTIVESLEKKAPNKLKSFWIRTKNIVTGSPTISKVLRVGKIVGKIPTPATKALGTLLTLGTIGGIGYTIYSHLLSSKKPQEPATSPGQEKVPKTPKQGPEKGPVGGTKKVKPKGVAPITPEEEAYLQSRIEMLKNLYAYDPHKGSQIASQVEQAEEIVVSNAENVSDFLTKALQLAEQLIAQNAKVLEAQRESIYAEFKELMKELNTLSEEKANAVRSVVTTYLNEQREILNKLLAKAPTFGPDEKTQLARNIAFNLLAIVSVFSPESRMYFLASIPKIVEYWRNEDAYNFDRHMREFQTVASLSKTQLEALAEQVRLLTEMINAEYDVPIKSLIESIKGSLDLYNQLYKLQLSNFLSLKDTALAIAKLYSDQETRKKMLDLRYLQMMLNNLYRQEQLRLSRERLALQRKKLEEELKRGGGGETPSLMDRLRERLFKPEAKEAK